MTGTRDYNGMLPPDYRLQTFGGFICGSHTQQQQKRKSCCDNREQHRLWPIISVLTHRSRSMALASLLEDLEVGNHVTTKETTTSNNSSFDNP